MKITFLHLNDREVKIKSLPLGKYADLLGAIQELPKNLNLIDGISNDKIMEQLPTLLRTSMPDVVRILTIATPLTKEEIESDDFGLDEATQVIAAVIEVNNYKNVFDTIKKVIASTKTQTNTPPPSKATGSPA